MQIIDVHKLVDESKFNRFHAKVLAWCFLIIVIDGYDIAISGVALPSIMKDMGVDASTAGFMASSALFGMVLGAVFLGALADKIGRRVTIALCVFLFSAFTAAAGFANDPVTFSALRFLAGLGIGGAMPNIIVQMTEYSPKSIRSLMTTVMYSGYAIGGITAAVIGKQFVVEFGWQVAFWAGGIPLVLIPFILKTMPESLGVLSRKNDSVDLRKVVSQISPSTPIQQSATFAFPVVDTKSGTPLAQLFAGGRGVSTVMFWIAFFTGLFMVYALSTWLTKLMALSGYDISSALSFVIALNMGAVAGAVFGGLLADKLHIKWVLVCMYTVGAVLLYTMTLKPPAEYLLLIVGGIGACTTGALIVAYAYCAQFYPTTIRSAGVGMAHGVGRVGSILAPVLIGFIVSINLPLEQNFLVIAAAGLIGATALLFVNHGLSGILITPKQDSQVEAVVSRQAR